MLSALCESERNRAFGDDSLCSGFGCLFWFDSLVAGAENLGNGFVKFLAFWQAKMASHHRRGIFSSKFISIWFLGLFYLISLLNMWLDSGQFPLNPVHDFYCPSLCFYCTWFSLFAIVLLNRPFPFDRLAGAEYERYGAREERALKGWSRSSKIESGTEIGNSLEFDFVVSPPHRLSRKRRGSEPCWHECDDDGHQRVEPTQHCVLLDNPKKIKRLGLLSQPLYFAIHV